MYASAGAPAGPGLFCYIDQLQQGSSGLSHDQREHLRHQIVHDLSVHSLSEKEVLYPALKSAFGKDLRDHVLDEHTSLKVILTDIDKMGADDPAFQPRLKELNHELCHHVREEEENVLPKLAARLARDELSALGDKFEKTKGHVPTRPHTMAPDKPVTGNVVADRVTAPLDKMRDAAAGRDV
ncbi:MAG: hypothetical protein J3K34DRAFT_467927 [Monoraphidium minutum]|nr:MAG: hypothetical protein J3K34DRAFT_467927 [Monoraphidium minutum]